ncbi:MAG: hypothetical protein ACRD4X_14700 [Candidatus Acidiferrales bacterium]
MPDPISTIKSISELIKKYNDLELMGKIVELQTEVYELQTESLALRRQLEERTKMQMRGPHEYFYQEGDEVPFCPKCWESEHKAIHLPNSHDFGSYHGRICRVCRQSYKEGPNRH